MVRRPKSKQPMPASVPENTNSSNQHPITIQNCTFTGNSTDSMVALAQAAKSNAEAIKALAESIRQTAPMLVINTRDE